MTSVLVGSEVSGGYALMLPDMALGFVDEEIRGPGTVSLTRRGLDLST